MKLSQDFGELSLAVQCDEEIIISEETSEDIAAWREIIIFHNLGE